MRHVNIFAEVTDHSELTPTVQDSGLAYNFQTGVISWVRGNGEQSILVAAKKPILFFPLDGISYSKSDDNAVFFVVYKGSATNVNITALLSSALYFYLVGYSGVQSTEKYFRDGIMSIFVPAPGGEMYIATEDGQAILTEDGQQILVE